MSIIICPNCKSTLHQSEKTLKCLNGHSFDIAKGGYINLLLANQKKKNSPGDNKVMTNSREDFLSTGAFDFLLESIESTVDSNGYAPAPNGPTINLLDVGCGTGYYTRNLLKNKNAQRIGIDISKVAIAKAATKDKGSTYIVGSAFGLPIEDSTIDLLLNVFSPIHIEELKRVLKPGGYYIKVVPTGDHMKEIAELVYEKFVSHQSSIKEEIANHSTFRIVSEQVLKRKISLSKRDLQNFIAMTPYLYKFKKEEIDLLEDMTVTISFEIIIARYN